MFMAQHMVVDGGGATATADASGGGPASAAVTASGGAGGPDRSEPYRRSSRLRRRCHGHRRARFRCGAVPRTPPQLLLADPPGGERPGVEGAANAASSATTTRGALAQAQSTAVGSSAEAQSIAQTSFYATVVQSVAIALTEGAAATDAIAQAGAPGQAFVNPGRPLTPSPLVTRTKLTRPL